MKNVMEKKRKRLCRRIILHRYIKNEFLIFCLFNMLNIQFNTNEQEEEDDNKYRLGLRLGLRSGLRLGIGLRLRLG